MEDWSLSDAEDKYIEAVRQEKARRASHYVINGIPRDDALEKAEIELEAESAALDDVTGVLDADLDKSPLPKAPAKQAKAVMIELLEQSD